VVKVYNDESFKVNSARSFQAHTSQITRLIQSPFSSGYAATCSFDYTVKIWNPFSNWTLVRTLSGHSSSIEGLEWINDDTIATGSSDSTLRIWTISSGTTIRTIQPGNGVSSLRLLSNGLFLAAGLYTSGNINIYNVNTGSQIATLRGHTATVWNFLLINNDIMVSAGGTPDNTIRIWNLTSYTQKFVFSGHGDAVTGLKLLSSNSFASSSNDRTIKIWNYVSGYSIRTLTGHGGWVMWAIDLMSDGQTLMSGANDYSIKMWNWQTGACLQTINAGLNIRALSLIKR
jgi:WD40 repeat protein